MKKIILVLMMLFVLYGCKTLDNKTYYGDKITVILVDKINMSEFLNKTIKYDPLAKYCTAYYDFKTKIAYVPYQSHFDNDENIDIHGEYLPDFELLGHEMWHHINDKFHGGLDLTNTEEQNNTK